MGAAAHSPTHPLSESIQRSVVLTGTQSRYDSATAFMIFAVSDCLVAA